MVADIQLYRDLIRDVVPVPKDSKKKRCDYSTLAGLRAVSYSNHGSEICVALREVDDLESGRGGHISNLYDTQIRLIEGSALDEVPGGLTCAFPVEFGYVVGFRYQGRVVCPCGLILQPGGEH